MRVLINTKREGYAIDQIKNTMTVGELIAFLEQFDDETPVYLKNDNGYTYGGITERCFEEEYDDEEDEDEE